MKFKKASLLLIVLMVFVLLITACDEADTPEETAQTPAGESEMLTSTPEGQPAEGEAVPTETAEQPAPEGEPPTEETAPEATESSVSEEPAATPLPGRYTVDTGFRPAKNGFGFENYADQGTAADGSVFPVSNLNEADMQRMFGDGVCAGKAGKEGCKLSPPARQWLEETNAAVRGGHCEGFAVLSQLFYGGVLDPKQFGADLTPSLTLKGNEPLQREIAYWWTTQMSIWEQQHMAGAADQVKFLMAEYKKDPKNLYRVGITKADSSGGHAVTAYAVNDEGGGIYHIMVYDNNYPGQERFILVDANKNTWQYEASINPQVESVLYTGDDNNMMMLAPNQPRLGTLPCPFCGTQGQASKGLPGLAKAEIQYNQLWVEGAARLLLVDDQDRATGFKDGKFINEIPGVKYAPILAGPDSENPPVYNVPVGTGFTAMLDGSQIKTDQPVDAVMIGPGYYIGVEGIQLDKDRVDQLNFDGEGDFITYTTDSAETPTITVGVEMEKADFQLDLAGVKIDPGTDIHVVYDGKEGYIALSTTSEKEGSYAIDITRIDAETEEEETFGTDESEPIVLGPGDIIYFYFGEWEGNGSNLEVGFDEGGDGTVDEVVNMADQE